MIREATDPAFVRTQMQAIRAHIAAGADPELAARAVEALPRAASASPSAALLAALPADSLGAPSSGGSRPSPTSRSSAATRSRRCSRPRWRSRRACGIRSRSATSRPRAEAAPATTAFFLDGGQFTTTDPRWVTEVAKALVRADRQGQPPVQPGAGRAHRRPTALASCWSATGAAGCPARATSARGWPRRSPRRTAAGATCT